MPAQKNVYICIANEGYEASLDLRKVYETCRDIPAEKRGYLRVIDESGEDYLFPSSFFRAIVLPRGLRRTVFKATGLKPKNAVAKDGLQLRQRLRAPAKIRHFRGKPA